MLPQPSTTFDTFATKRRALRTSKDEVLDMMLRPHMHLTHIPLSFARNVKRRYMERDAAKDIANTVATKISNTQDALFLVTNCPRFVEGPQSTFVYDK